MRILVIDDNLQILAVTVDMLRAMGYIAHSLPAPLKIGAISKKLQSDNYGVVITDLEMEKDYDGGDVIHLSKKIGIPVILTSGNPSAIEIAKENDVVFLGKPATIQELKNAIKEALEPK